MPKTHFPQPHQNQRAVRVQFHSMAPAAIRFEDGRRGLGKLRTISLTGGLLRLSKPLVPGTLIEVIFMSNGGPVLAWIIHEVSSQKRKDALKGMMNTGFARPAFPVGASIA